MKQISSNPLIKELKPRKSLDSKSHSPLEKEVSPTGNVQIKDVTFLPKSLTHIAAATMLKEITMEVKKPRNKTSLKSKSRKQTNKQKRHYLWLLALRIYCEPLN